MTMDKEYGEALAKLPIERRQKCRACRHLRHDHVPHSEGGTYCWSRDSVDGMWCECTEFKEVGQ